MPERAKKSNNANATNRLRIQNVTAPSGDVFSVSIGVAGRVTLRSLDVSDDTLPSFVVTGLTRAEATAQSKGFWGGLWDKIKTFAKKVYEAITVNIGGGLTCRPDIKIGIQNGQIKSTQVGIVCS